MAEKPLLALTVAAVLVACGAPPPPPVTAAGPQLSETSAPAVGSTPAATGGAGAALPTEPARVTFPLADGTQIVGTFYPPSVAPAPGVLLMHQRGMDRTAWEPLILALQGEISRSHSQTADERPNYAVLAIDAPGHGESTGEWTPQGMLEAANLALQLLRTQPGVDKDRIVIIGASMGSDAALDECGEGCIGVVTLSPGSFLGVYYNTALAAMGDRPVLCAASKDDARSAATCEGGRTVGLKNYQVQIYDGAAHGNMLILQNPDIKPSPQPLPLIMEWLAINVPLK
jgi:alpha/beta hydrolase family protein